MKRWIPFILLPLILISTPAVAQANKTTTQEDLSQVQTQAVLSSNTQPLLVPMTGTDQVQLRLVNCSWFDCPLARLILPASTFVDQWQLQFDNSSSTSVTVLNSAVVAKNVEASYQITNASISLPKDSQSLPANQIVSLPLTINRSAIPPDHYSGAIYLTLANQGSRLILPLSISMRTGPLLPLLVLLTGIAIGRLFKYMQERGEPQANVLKEINRLSEDIASADPEDQKALSGTVVALRKAAYREKFETSTQQIESIRNRLEALNQLRVMEKSLKGKEQHPKVKEVVEQIAQVRQFYLFKEDTKAKELSDKIVQTLPGLTTMMGSESSESKKLSDATINFAAAADRAATGPVISISGLSDQVRAEATLWIGRPLISLLLLLGLSAVGFNTLYIENGEAFGARPFPDYLGLILWGMSADVASRNLSSLQDKKERD